jgi:hypothetical protein
MSEFNEDTLKKVEKLVRYLCDELWPYGSGRFPDSERYQLAEAKKQAREIRKAMKDQ